jgi:kelch-like protein 10
LTVFQDRLYLFGGWNGKRFEDTIFIFDPAEQRWEQSASAMPQAKGYAGAAVLDDLIYVVGGYDGQEEFDQTYVFKPETGEWLKKSPMLEKRGGLGLISAANNLYAVGGGWEQALASSEKYDPATDTWEKLESPFEHPWRNMGLAATDSRIYAVGGWNGEEDDFMNAVRSHQYLFQLFLPIGFGN